MSTLAPAAVPQSAVAVSGKSKIKLLGYIVWFSIPTDPVSTTRLRKAWMLAGLDPAPLPRDSRAGAVFQRAMRAQEVRHKNPDGTTTETDVVDVLQSEQEIVYQVSRVVRDKDGKIADYPKALQAIFNKEHGSVHFKPLGGVARTDVLPMMEEISDYIEHNAKTVTGNKVRGIVRTFIKSDPVEQIGRVGLSGESLRGQAGGVYFVLERYSEQLEGLSQALSELYPHDRAYLHAVPLADGATERELIRRHHVASTMDDAKKTIAKVRTMLREDRKKAVRSDIAQHHWSALQGLKRRVGLYEQALRGEEEEVHDVMTLLERQLKELV